MVMQSSCNLGAVVIVCICTVAIQVGVLADCISVAEQVTLPMLGAVRT